MDSYLHGKGSCHIDLTVLDNVRKQMPGRPDIVSCIISSLLRSSPALLDALRAAILEGDMDAVHKAAHAMKSSNAQIGAHRLAAICQRLEAQTPDAEAVLQELEQEYHEVENDLGLLLARSNGQAVR
jgi:two-component system, sensor histidine kinase and response regulator